uniref:Uncharacterized protein n=1 Tax=viral metagenome TaxID=1070528 RepID=A0A6M3K9E4_9ZZZZ
MTDDNGNGRPSAAWKPSTMQGPLWRRMNELWREHCERPHDPALWEAYQEAVYL